MGLFKKMKVRKTLALDVIIGELLKYAGGNIIKLLETFKCTKKAMGSENCKQCVEFYCIRVEGILVNMRIIEELVC